MGQALGGERLKCQCNLLATTEITLTGASLPSEPRTPETTTNQGIDIAQLLSAVASIAIPDLEAIAQHTGYHGWDGRIQPRGMVKYFGCMCDSCANAVLENIQKIGGILKLKKENIIAAVYHKYYCFRLTAHCYRASMI